MAPRLSNRLNTGVSAVSDRLVMASSRDQRTIAFVGIRQRAGHRRHAVPLSNLPRPVSRR